jgi:hypothetical protein
MAMGFMVLSDIIRRITKTIAHHLRHPSLPFQLTIFPWQGLRRLLSAGRQHPVHLRLQPHLQQLSQAEFPAGLTVGDGGGHHILS